MAFSSLNKVVSQRLIVSIVGIILIQISWRWAVAHLYTLPQEALAGFVTITTNSMYVTGSIVIFMVTGRMVYDWKVGTNQIQDVSSSVQYIKEEIIKRFPKPKHFDDETI